MNILRHLETTSNKLAKKSRLFSTNTSAHYMSLEKKYGCHNYEPVPVVQTKGLGCKVWDVEGKEYYDCQSGYSAVNQGHCHPKIKQAMIDQLDRITLTARAFYNDKQGPFEQYITNLLGYDKVIFMNSGVEGGETAIKFARKWAYESKGLKQDSARIAFAQKNFWGRTLAACGSSDDPERYTNFGPFNLNFDIIPYNDLTVLENYFKANPDCAGFMLEPIQGEAGVIIPDTGYLKGVRALCDKYNVLMIVDEVQTGFGRTGDQLCINHEGVKPDMLILGKSLSGGFYPVSCVLADDKIMNHITYFFSQ